MTDIVAFAEKYNGRIETINGYDSLCGCNVKLSDIKVGQIWIPADGAKMPVRVNKIVEDNVYYSAINMDYKNDNDQFKFQSRYLLTNKIARYAEGDLSKGICDPCGLVDTTFKFRDVPIKDFENRIIKHILVGCCNTCDAVIAVPEQSVKQVSEGWKQLQQEIWNEMNAKDSN